jgi:(p)ppGpp synthase/HD superfamily hydrolase
LPGVPEGIFIEVQIRTVAMHRKADLGIAAHWSYKEGGSAQHASRREQIQRALTMQQPLEERAQSALTDHIFALTPNGDIIELPEGATPLDFAFNVHSMLGLCFKAARVNGNIVPLTYHLENGDIVEILKHPEPHPSPNWMQLLKTSAAKSRLKRYLLAQDRPAFVELGREMINAELHRHHLPHLDPDLTILKLFDGKRLSFSDREDILVSVGQGAQNTSAILMHLDALEEWAEKMRHLADAKQKVVPPTLAAIAQVEGKIPMPVRYARCCKPNEGTRGEITGIIGRDGMVRVHRTTCKHIRNGNPERRIGVSWVREKK